MTIGYPAIGGDQEWAMFNFSGVLGAPFNNNGDTPNAYLPVASDSDLPTVKRALVKDKKALEFL